MHHRTGGVLPGMSGVSMYLIWVVLLVLSGAAMLPAPVDAARAGLADSTTVARPRFPSAPT